MWTFVFISLGYIAGSNGLSVFNHLKNCQTVVFLIAAPFYILLAVYDDPSISTPLLTFVDLTL